MNKNYVQINQYLGGKSREPQQRKKERKKHGGTKEGAKSQTSQGGIRRSGDAKRDVKNLRGSHRRGKTKKPEEAAGMKQRCVRVYDQVR